MVRAFGPFPGLPMYEVVNRRMQRALAAATASTGLASAPGSTEALVTAGTGANLSIAAYPTGAIVDGLWVENPAAETWPVPANTNTQARINRLVLRLDMAANKIEPYVIVGTPASTPVAPALTQAVDGSVFDLPLCRFTMPGSGSAQNPTAIVDERVHCNGSPAMVAYRAANTTISPFTGMVTIPLDTVSGSIPGLTLNPATGVLTAEQRGVGTYAVAAVISLIQDGALGDPGIPIRLYPAALVNGTETHRGLDQIVRTGHLIGDVHSRDMPTRNVTLAANGTLALGLWFDSARAARVSPGLAVTWMSIRKVS